MLNAYQAVITNGQLTWLDPIPNLENQTVTVIVLPNQPAEKPADKPRKIGMSAGKTKFPDDINKYDDEVARLFGVEL